LRKKLEPDPGNPTLIKTVRGGGYVFASPVTAD
jgi:two-component system OmpR family response regulator